VNTVRTAVVGLGGWGPNLARNVESCPATELAVLCEQDPARLASVAARYPGAQKTTALEEVLADPTIEAVVLATPAGLHEEHAHAALDAGKHVLVEKPLALSVAGGRALADHAARAGRILMAGHTFLYNGAVLAAREQIVSGALGRVYCVMAERLSLGKVREDVNAMWNLAPHDFSILNHWFGGVPVRVRATGGRFLPGSTVEDVTMATLEYPGGALAYVHSSWLNPLKVRRMTVIGERRMLVYDDTSEDRPVVVHDQGVDSEAFDDPSGSFARFKRALRRGSEEVVAVDPAEPLGEEIAHFALCIRKGRVPAVAGE
jgi:predicted dehydrogenase